MILGQPKTPQNFTEWLDAATRDLVLSAQARVRPEIEAHYSEAVKSHLQNGASESVAQAAALLELGDAYAAAKRFQRQYLTQFSVAHFSDYANIDRRISAVCMVLVLLATEWYFVFPTDHKLPLWFWLTMVFWQFLVLISSCLIKSALNKQKSDTQTVVRLFVAHIYLRLFSVIAIVPTPLLGFIPSLKHHTLSEFLILLGVCWIYMLTGYYVVFLLWKRRLAGKNDSHPRQSAAA